MFTCKFSRIHPKRTWGKFTPKHKCRQGGGGMENFMNVITVPTVFLQLQSDEYICMSDISSTQDGFCMVNKSLSDILAQRGILDFPGKNGARYDCDKFYDDWFLYAVTRNGGCVYSLLKLREQENDADGDVPADGDTPGVTLSFISFDCEPLLSCLADPTDENRIALDSEIDRVAAQTGQRHDKSLKSYFVSPETEGAYLIADCYVKYIASLAKNSVLEVPVHYGEIAENKKTSLRRFIESVNQAAGCVVCDHEKIYIQNSEELTEHERAAILATHTGNTSVYSFAAEVEYHARFLFALARIRIPIVNISLYESAIRADMTIGDGELRRYAPFYRENSRVVKRQHRLHIAQSDRRCEK